MPADAATPGWMAGMMHLPAMVATALTLAYPAGAQTNAIPTTASMTVTAQIVSGCGVVAGRPGSGLDFGKIDFGTYPAIARGSFDAMTVGGTLQIECSPNVMVMMSIDTGGHSSGNDQRNLAGPNGALIPYRLYSDNARTQPLDVGKIVSTAISGTASLPIYGRVTLNGGATPAGSYTDVAQVTLTY